MSWKQKEKTISSKQIIDSSISFDNLGCTKDEDDMASDSATHLPTQQSVKAYVDDNKPRKSYFYRDVTVSLVNGYTNLTDTIHSSQTPNGTDRFREIEFVIDYNYGGIPASVVNDVQFSLEVNSGLTSYRYSTFTATHVGTFRTGFHTISFDGDVSGYFAEGVAISASLTTNTYSHKFPAKTYYDPSSDKTFVEYSTIYGQLMASGTLTVYVSWNQFTTNSSIWKVVKYFNLDTYQSTTSTTGHSAILKCAIGVTSDEVRYRLRAREFGSYDSITINEITATMIDTKWD